MVYGWSLHIVSMRFFYNKLIGTGRRRKWNNQGIVRTHEESLHKMGGGHRMDITAQMVK